MIAAAAGSVTVFVCMAQLTVQHHHISLQRPSDAALSEPDAKLEDMDNLYRCQKVDESWSAKAFLIFLSRCVCLSHAQLVPFYNCKSLLWQKLLQN